MVNIAVLGYGTVGSGVVEVINTNHASINKRAGADINIKYVLDLRDFPGDPVEKVLVHDYDVIANDPEVDIVVEVMGGIEPAYTFVKRALEAGKSVCTSNKALVAKHGPELMEIAREKNINFLFEASCGGGIPMKTARYLQICWKCWQIMHCALVRCCGIKVKRKAMKTAPKHILPVFMHLCAIRVLHCNCQTCLLSRCS